MTRRDSVAAYLPYARLFLLGAIIGSVVFFLIFGFSTLDVTYDSWIRCGYIEEDIIQHYATWQFFRNDEWQFSLTWMNNAAGPEGVAAAWGDPLPWAALFFKALSPVLPATFQYFGIIGLLHFVLQGGFAALLVSLFDRRWSLCGAGSLLFCLQPVFLERMFRHMALTAQWLVLAMFCLYFIGRRIGRMPWFWWCVVFGLIPGVHPYFLPMAFGLICASALEIAIKERKVLRSAGAVLLSVAVALASARTIGVIMPGVSTGDGGFGRYSMNMNALINPRSADFYAENNLMDWSLLLSPMSQQFHQYDGFNYLGIGVLATIAGMLVCSAVAIARQGVKNSAKRLAMQVWNHIGLVVASIAFTVFAVSNIAYFGETLVYQVALPEFIDRVFSSFRASGRIFWPVNYLITLGCVLFISRNVRWSGRKAAALVLLLVVAVQAADMSGVLGQKHRHFCGDRLEVHNDYETEKARQLIAGTDTIACLGGPIMEYRFAECLIRYNPKIQTDIVFFVKGNFYDTYSYYPLHYEKLISGEPIDENTLYVASEKSYCDEVLALAHEDVVAWKLEKFYLFGVATEDRPAPDFE